MLNVREIVMMRTIVGCVPKLKSVEDKNLSLEGKKQVYVSCHVSSSHLV